MSSPAPWLPEALAFLHAPARVDEALALLRALVEQSSHTLDPAGVDAAHEVLRAALPLPARRVPSGERAYGSHLAYAPAGVTPRALLVGHLDTVFPREKFQGFALDGPLARGPGVLDMKGGLVVVSLALRALETVGALRAAPLALVVVSDEEVGSPTSTPLVRELARGAEVALVFESGRPDDGVVTARKGTATLSVEARGRAAHAGNAHAQGANALWALARWIDRAQGVTDYDRGRTVNVGQARGGLGKNTVPDEARAEVDLRFVTARDGDALRAALEAHAREAAASVPGTSLRCAWGPARPPMERTERSAALCARYLEGAREEGLGGGELPVVGGASDGNTTAAEGVPTLDALGPRGRGFHTLDEQVQWATLAPKAGALLRFLARAALVAAALTLALVAPSRAAHAGVAGGFGAADGVASTTFERHDDEPVARRSPVRSRALPPVPVALRASLRVAHGFGALRLTGERAARFERQAVVAGVEVRLTDRLAVQLGVGALLGGALLVGPAPHEAEPAASLRLEPGFAGYAGVTFRALDAGDAGPYLLLTAAVGLALTATRARDEGAEATALSSYDLRAGAVLGRTFARRAGPYLAVRALGGPLFWRYRGLERQGFDAAPYQVALGVAVRAGASLDAFAELAPLGDGALTAGASARF